MSKLKSRTKDKVKKLSSDTIGSCALSIPKAMVSFGHVTSNKSHNFDYFGKDIRKNLEARIGLDSLLQVITTSTWPEIFSKPRTALGGTEKIPFGQLRIGAISSLPLAKDKEVYSFGFKERNYRMCGVKEEGCAVLHIIAYDFNHSLYDHGS